VTVSYILVIVSMSYYDRVGGGNNKGFPENFKIICDNFQHLIEISESVRDPEGSELFAGLGSGVAILILVPDPERIQMYIFA